MPQIFPPSLTRQVHHTDTYAFADCLAFPQTDGLACVKTNQAVLVCHYASPIIPGQATKVVEGLADYLIGQGF